MSVDPRQGAWFAPWLRRLAAPIVRAMFRLRAEGAQNVPSGGAILAGNHASYADPVLLWCLAPRRVHFMAKSDLFQGVLGWGLPRLWSFPVRRGVADRTALSIASDILREGGHVGIFPEGTRHLDEGLGEAHGGVAFLAIRNDVPVVPVGIAGTDRIWPKGQKLPSLSAVRISYGTPLRPEEYAQGGTKDRVDSMTEELMRRIAEELEKAREV